MRTDEAVRAALADLAAQARPTDLVQGALRAGRRRQRKRYGVSAGAIAAVTAAVVAIGFGVLPGRGQQAPPVGARPSSPQVAVSPTTMATLDGGTARITGTVTPAPLVGGWYPQLSTKVYDAIHHTYVDVAGDQIWPSLSGTAVAFARFDDNSTVYLTDFASGVTSTLSVADRLLNPQWTLDGTRLLFSVSDKYGDGHIDARIYNLKTHNWSGFTVNVPLGYCVWCELSWLPDGHRIAISRADRTISPGEGGAEIDVGLQLFSDIGTKLSYLPVRGRVSSAAAWSPDGTYVVVTGTELHDGLWAEVPQLYRTDGTLVRDIPVSQATPFWVDSTRVLLVEDYEVNGPGSEQQWWIALRGLDGALIDRWIDPDQPVQTLVRSP